MSVAHATSVDAMTADSAARVRRAASGRAGPEELRELAGDPNVLVRAAVAINRSCAPEVDHVLAGDADERVRALLGGRIARLLPELQAQDCSRAAEHVRSTLALLVEDEAVRVRAAIAEAVKEMPEAPRELVLRLAHDRAVQVSDPVVRLSPVLTDADLLTLLATPPYPGVVTAIAARPGVSPALTDAIAAHANAPAIKTMLANPSARISEATLDGLVGQAPEHQDWHGPLVRRPMLSATAASALSSFVTTQLLDVLARRTDLDPAIMHTIRARLSSRLKVGNPDDNADRALITEFFRMRKAGVLDEATLLATARTGEARRLAAILAVTCEVPLSTIDRVVALRSAKALVSLVWRAGFSMQAAVAVQTILGQLGPAHVLAPARGGSFPLSEEEMRWQLELLNESGQRAAASAFRKAAPAPARAMHHA